MTEFVCERCGFYSKDRYGLIRHFNRKNLCVASVKDVSKEELLMNIQKNKEQFA
jgi:hypothetical protein